MSSPGWGSQKHTSGTPLVLSRVCALEVEPVHVRRHGLVSHHIAELIAGAGGSDSVNHAPNQLAPHAEPLRTPAQHKEERCVDASCRIRRPGRGCESAFHEQRRVELAASCRKRRPATRMRARDFGVGREGAEHGRVWDFGLRPKVKDWV